jgi:hypothetical protein
VTAPRKIRRLTDEELFHIGPQGIYAISDETLELRLNEAERRALQMRQAAPAYPELLEHPECM